MNTPAAFIVMVLLAAALALAAWRLLRGPSMPDRVMALDLAGIILGALIAAIGLFAGQPMLLDVLLVFSILQFCGTVVFARYLERRVDDSD